MPEVVFAFDLDGTITACELLPYIATACGVAAPLQEMTRNALQGLADYESSLRERITLLGRIHPADVRAAVSAAPLVPEIVDFITAERHRCAVVTANIDIWVSPVIEHLGCRAFTSSAVWKELSQPTTLPGHGIRTMPQGGLCLLSLVDKAAAINTLRRERAKETGLYPADIKVIAVGESFNDIQMLEQADVGIAFAGVHEPAPRLLAAATLRADSGKELCELLAKASNGQGFLP